jgi:glycine/D-amino acid oxidase-like deaminating enzyme
MTLRACDVAIVGAGIVGAACAYQCALAGLRVAVIEAGDIGGGATAAGMGHLVVMDDSDAQFALTRYSVALWHEMAESRLPRDIEFESCGTIWVAADVAEMAAVYRKETHYRERGVAVEILDSHSLAEAEPNLRAGLPGGLLVPADAVLYPPCAARFLMERAQELGAELHRGRLAVELAQDGVRLEDGSFVPAAVTVNAAGNDAAGLTAGLGMRPRKGHLVITDRYPGFLRHQLVELGYCKSAHSSSSDSVAFNVQPRSTGQVLIGSSRQLGRDDRHVDQAILRRMTERAVEYMPALGTLSAIRVWTGFRPATPDNLPLIGPLPERRNLYLATGHEGLGITTSLGTARLLVDQLLQRESEIPVEPYLPSRVHQNASRA